MDIQPYEANSALAQQEMTGVVLDGTSVSASTALVVEYDPAFMEPGSPVLYRINNGGPLLGAADGSSPHWAEDTASSPSPLRTAGGDDLYDMTFGTAHPGPIDISDPGLAPAVPPLCSTPNDTTASGVRNDLGIPCGSRHGFRGAG